jgi:hypothetical protein
MEYNSNTKHELEWLRGCNKQRQLWDGTNQNKELNPTLKNESENFLGGSF